ncbi:extracellular solute-binding protein [Paenibacillus sp. MBLB4367]|uniref:extracellular solute-binding protein n=1 Tax=Paenibacillus sp. MBLB4367 TaxID=3384767 RepID=UPI003908362B
MRSFRGIRTMLAAMLSVFVLITTSCDSTAPEQAGSNDGQPISSGIRIVGLNCNPSFDRQTAEEKRVHDRIAEQTGVDVRFVFSDGGPGGPCRSKRAAMLSSGEQLDFAELSITEAVQAFNEGLLLPLNDLLDRYGTHLKTNIVPEAFKLATYEGNILGIPIENGLYTLNALQIRADWLAKLQLPLPRTIDEFEQVLKAFKERDPDGNGKMDTVPLTVVSDGAYNMLEGVLGSSFLPQGYAWWQDADGKLKPPELHPAYKQLLAKLASWNEKGYLWSDLLLSAANKQQELIADNRAGAVAASFSGTIVNAGEVLRKSVSDYSYVPIVLEGEQGLNRLPASPVTHSVWVIYKKNASPEAVMKFFDYQGTYEGNMLTSFGIEGDNYTATPDGMVEFISEDKTDLAKAHYYAKYKTVFINWPGKPVWPINTWTSAEYNLKREQVNRLPRFEPIDYGVYYDTTKWQSYSKLGALNAYLSEQKVRVLNGEIRVDSWDGIIARWLEMGGSQMIDDRNKQYAASVSPKVSR